MIEYLSVAVILILLVNTVMQIKYYKRNSKFILVLDRMMHKRINGLVMDFEGQDRKITENKKHFITAMRKLEKRLQSLEDKIHTKRVIPKPKAAKENK